MTQSFARSALLLVASSALALSAANASAAVHHKRHHHAAAKPAAKAEKAEASTYTVRKGDTLGAIADKLGVSVTELKRANHLKGSSLRLGQVLKVPGAAAPAKASGKASRTEPAEEAAAPSTYKVKKGDTLGKIAAKLGVSVAELKKANHLKGSAVKPGHVLKVPGGEAASKSSRAEASEERAKPTTYKVRHGDTLGKIAKKTGVSVAELRAANGLTRRSNIHSGQVLKLSAEEAAPARRTREAHAAPAEETYAPVESTSRAIGQVVEVEGPRRTYRAKRGDTLAKVAEKLGVSVAELKRENHLRSNHVKRGQVFHGRGEMVKAYVVGPRDTIYSIARRFDVTVEKLKAVNGLGHRGSIHTGQKLRLPAGYHDRGAAAGSFTPPTYQAPPATTEPTPQPPTRPAITPPTRPSYAPPLTAGAPPAVAPTQSPQPTDAQISEMGRGRFIWPLQGQIISEFGAKPTGQKNDGINIEANTGDPVRAAAAGSIVYAGDQVPGYGNLVLINHADGWVTAYAHLSKVEVKMQQKVTQGQEIGLAGSTGGVSQPQVHFEVRYHSNPSDRALPIDPKLVLPRP
jgi:LysM repeat protein